MSWIKYQKGSLPEKLGEYFVVKFFEGTKDMGFFKPVPPKKEIHTMLYNQAMKLEENFADRCVYVKYNAWFDKHGLEQKNEEILYWYKLDEIPEEEK